jgi:hypothetical protein
MHQGIHTSGFNRKQEQSIVQILTNNETCEEPVLKKYSSCLSSLSKIAAFLSRFLRSQEHHRLLFT